MANITKINGNTLRDSRVDNIKSFNYTVDAQISGQPIVQLIDIIYPIGSIYFSGNNTNPSTLFGGTTWELVGEKLAVKENVFGNGIGLAITDGNRSGVLQGTVSALNGMYQAFTGLGNSLGQSTSNWSANSIGNSYKTIGVPTKSQLGANPQYSGLIVDTVSIYSWKRVA